METSSTQQRSLILYVDRSKGSEAVEEALTQARVNFRVVNASGTIAPLPAIATQHGLVRGLSNIRRYLLPEVKAEA